MLQVTIRLRLIPSLLAMHFVHARGKATSLPWNAYLSIDSYGQALIAQMMKQTRPLRLLRQQATKEKHLESDDINQIFLEQISLVLACQVDHADDTDIVKSAKLGTLWRNVSMAIETAMGRIVGGKKHKPIRGMPPKFRRARAPQTVDPDATASQD
jgi:hypothetical protein